MEEGKISKELARIHAHLCGDGSVYTYKTQEKGRKKIAVIGYYNKNQRLLDNFRADFSKIFNVKMSMRNNRDVYVKSQKIFNKLISKFGKFGSKEWRIPRIIKKSNKYLLIEWLKAFFEDEAYHEKRYNRLKIKSMNLDGLKDIREILTSLNIFSSLTGPNCDKSYYLTIPKFDSILEFNGFVKVPIRK